MKTYESLVLFIEEKVKHIRQILQLNLKNKVGYTIIIQIYKLMKYIKFLI